MSDLDKIREDVEKYYSETCAEHYNLVKDLRDKPLFTLNTLFKFAAMYNCERGQYLNKMAEINEKELEQLRAKAKKWDALGVQICKCYCDENGEYSEDNPEIEDADLCTIGEMAARAYGWL